MTIVGTGSENQPRYSFLDLCVSRPKELLREIPN